MTVVPGGRAHWAAVEILRLTGCRVEELLEISHHSLIQYRLPTTGEIVPLLQIMPSKTDKERLLVVSPELADVLSTVISRIREPDGAVPLVPIYDRYECLWRSPSPVLFQRRFPSEIRAISDSSLRTMLTAALAHTGLKDPTDGQPLHYTPHDFRRIFITDAVMSGLPPHIAQIIAGHRDIKVTLGYKAVYPDEALQAHLAFLTRRRALHPGEEYRPLPHSNQKMREAYLSKTDFCELVAESVIEGLKVTGFRTGGDGSGDTMDDAWGWWQLNHLDADSGLVHRAAIVMSRGSEDHADGVPSRADRLAVPCGVCRSPLVGCWTSPVYLRGAAFPVVTPDLGDVKSPR